MGDEPHAIPIEPQKSPLEPEGLILPPTAIVELAQGDFDRSLVQLMRSLYISRQMKTDYGFGVSTLIVVINDLPSPLLYRNNHDWSGTMDPRSFAYLQTVNDVAPAFHHHSAASAAGSVGAVQFNATDRAGDANVVGLAWSTPHGAGTPNSCFVKLHSDRISWDQMEEDLSEAGKGSSESSPTISVKGRIAWGDSPFCIFYVG